MNISMLWGVKKWEPAPARRNVIPRDVINFSPATSQCVWVTFYKIFSEIVWKKNTFISSEKKIFFINFHHQSNCHMAPILFYGNLIWLKFTPMWCDLTQFNVWQILMAHLLKYNMDKVIWKCWWHEIFALLILGKGKQREMVSLIER